MKWFNSQKEEIKEELKQFKQKCKGNYINLISSFDIETYSYKDVDYKGELVKKATMYVWQFAILQDSKEIVIFGRTWSDFIDLLELLNDSLNLDNEKKKLIIFIHNLSYEFQFFRKLLEWTNVFAIEKRQVLFATTGAFEFRCSYLLTGLPLSKLANNIQNHDIKKLTSQFDYEKPRHYKTPLTQEEIEYCINDVLIIVYFIQEELQKSGYNLKTLPYTKTSYVRNYCRKCCRAFEDESTKSKNSKKQWKEFRNLIQSLTIEKEEYTVLKKAFQGGFTHASALKVNKTLTHVDSIDFTSSYPAVMIAERFPMSKGEKIEIENLEQFNQLNDLYLTIFTIKLNNVKPLFIYDHFISKSRCSYCENETTDNGRIVTADSIILTTTNIDFEIIKKCYKFDSFQISTFYRYQKGYLPTPLIKSILNLYEKKTKLKGVKGKEYEYQISKGMLNSVYGMSVTDISKDEINYINDEWIEQEADIAEDMEKYNKNKKRYLFYPWGIFITAYARANLWSGLFEFKNDYIYSDTDSIKCINFKNHQDYIKNYNATILFKLKKACKFHNLDFSKISPKTLEGIEKPLGVWDVETNGNGYKRFKTLGAKRYLYEDNNGIHITVAGLSKKFAVDYLKKYPNPFAIFNNQMNVPKEYSGRLTHTYIDGEINGILTDYKGTTVEIHELSAIHLESSEFTLSMSKNYIDYLNKIKEDNNV